MKRWAALLRGVNLGGRKLLSADLKVIAQDLGFRRVETLLASGNVVFDGDGPAADIECRLEAALDARGLPTDVMVRDFEAIRKVIVANPFPEAARDHPSHLLVTFHRDVFPRDALDRLEAGPERLAAIDRELYIDFLSREGMRESKLVQAMAKAKFPKTATGRNWNTVTKLAAMLAD